MTAYQSYQASYDAAFASAVEGSVPAPKPSIAGIKEAKRRLRLDAQARPRRARADRAAVAEGGRLGRRRPAAWAASIRRGGPQDGGARCRRSRKAAHRRGKDWRPSKPRRPPRRAEGCRRGRQAKQAAIAASAAARAGYRRRRPGRRGCRRERRAAAPTRASTGSTGHARQRAQAHRQASSAAEARAWPRRRRGLRPQGPELPPAGAQGARSGWRACAAAAGSGWKPPTRWRHRHSGLLQEFGHVLVESAAVDGGTASWSSGRGADADLRPSRPRFVDAGLPRPSWCDRASAAPGRLRSATQAAEVR